MECVGPVAHDSPTSLPVPPQPLEVFAGTHFLYDDFIEEVQVGGPDPGPSTLFRVLSVKGVEGLYV